MMNLYLRYFDTETLVTSADEAIEFLYSIDEIGMDPSLEADVREYANSDVRFPKRYKIRPRVYFIIIKTDAATMQEFKERRNAKNEKPLTMEKEKPMKPALAKIHEEREGWYEGTMKFKRVYMVPGSGKFQYRDTVFVARVKAISGADCYNRIVEHLLHRVDERSQFPSIKGKNFHFTFLGKAKSL